MHARNLKDIEVNNCDAALWNLQWIRKKQSKYKE
jgi:hypothetical protein